MSGEGRIGPGPGPTLGAGQGLEQLVEGVVVDGRYRIVRRLGRGGMAVVFEVADEMLDGARRALKVLDPELILDRGPSEGESLVARFKQEVILGQERLSHPNIVRVYGYNRVVEGPLTLHYAVLELVAGETLHDWMKGQGEVTAETRWALLSQLAGVLAFAHRQGVVHRDVKPSNIFVEPAEESGGGLRLRLGDFGIARVLGQPTVSANGATPRTTFHCAPEQVRGDEVGAFTDVYLFGLVAYWLIHDGARWWDPTHSANPFPGSTGRDLADLVRQCLRSNGSDRPPDGDSLLHLLETAQRPREETPPAEPARPKPAVAVGEVGKPEPSGGHGSGEKRAKRTVRWARLVGLGALVVAFVVLGILIGKYGKR
ncbi:MAG: serine/threonine protein kinase, partial [bacterium]|nr:serine/threonine protein kinase [bacterium]